MLKFLKRHWESILFTIVLIVTGSISNYLDVRYLEEVFRYIVIGGLVFFGIKAIFWARYPEEKANRILYYVESAVDFGLAIYFYFGVKNCDTRLIGIIFLVVPLIKSFIAKSWIAQLYLDRDRVFFGIIWILFSVSQLLADKFYAGFLIYGWGAYVLSVIMIYYLIFYGRILAEDVK